MHIYIYIYIYNYLALFVQNHDKKNHMILILNYNTPMNLYLIYDARKKVSSGENFNRISKYQSWQQTCLMESPKNFLTISWVRQALQICSRSLYMVIPSLSLPLMFEWPGAVLSLQYIHTSFERTDSFPPFQSEWISITTVPKCNPTR